MRFAISFWLSISHQLSAYFPLESLNPFNCIVLQLKSSPKGRVIFSHSPYGTLTAAAVAAGSVFLALDPRLNDVGGASHTRVNTECRYRTIQSARTALHTPVAVNYFCFLFLQVKNTVRAYGQAHAASDAGTFIQGQRSYFVNIAKIIHGNHLSYKCECGPDPQPCRQKDRPCLSGYGHTHLFFDARGRRKRGRTGEVHGQV